MKISQLKLLIAIVALSAVGLGWAQPTAAADEYCCVCQDITTQKDKAFGPPSNGDCRSQYEVEECEKIGASKVCSKIITCEASPREGSCSAVQAKIDEENSKQASADAAEAYKRSFVIPQLQISIPGLSKFGVPTEVEVGTRKYYFVTWLGEYLNGIYRFAVGAGAVLAVVMIIVGGFIWLTSTGNQAMIGVAKGYIGGAIVGVIILLGSYIILQTLSPSLTNLQPIRLAKIGFEKLNEMSIEPQRVTNVSGGGWTGGNLSTYDDILKNYSDQFGIDCTKLKAHMLAESAGQPTAVSSAGACGLIQLLPKTAGKTCQELQDPATNIAAAAKYYKEISSKTCPSSATDASNVKHTCDTAKSGCSASNEIYVIAAYNGGSGSNCSSQTCPGKTWWQCPQNSGYAETRNYVTKVQSIYQTLKDNDWGC